MLPDPTLLPPHFELALLIVIAVLMGMLLIRFLLGPTPFDRLVTLDSFVLCLMCAMALWGMLVGSQFFMDIILVVSLLGFLSTVIVARYLDRRGGDGR